MSEETLGATKLFVLDTNIIMHDPSCMFRFQEHDVYIPSCVLEELDKHKKGTTDIARNVRQAMRFLTDMFEAIDVAQISEGIPLERTEGRGATGRLFFQTEKDTELLGEKSHVRADDQILAIAASLKKTRIDRSVVLVSKDLNLKVKASTRGISSEDYTTDNVLEDSDLIPPGVRKLSLKEWKNLMRHAKSSKQERHVRHVITSRCVKDLALVQNECIVIPHLGTDDFLFFVEDVTRSIAILRTLDDYTKQKNRVCGVLAKSVEQSIALNFLMDPEIDFVTLLGQAGTGKTLLTLAAGLEQVITTQRYHQIIMTRATVPIGDEIGFLPGDEEEKMNPWMGALDDNLQFLSSVQSESRAPRKDPARGGGHGDLSMIDLMRSRISVKSLSFMRGRTFIKKFLIIDEAQNLTSKQMKTLITRAGPGTKVVCLGNVAQIDTPYLTEGNSGITYATARFRGWKHYGHVTLLQGERSRLADHATKVM